jgi:hypothetical protein
LPATRRRRQASSGAAARNERHHRGLRHGIQERVGIEIAELLEVVVHPDQGRAVHPE